MHDSIRVPRFPPTPPIALMPKGEEGVYFKIFNLWYSLTVLL